MTDREKLIELLKAGGKLAVEENHKYIREFVKNHGRYSSKTDNNVPFDAIVADYLLENNVLPLELKPGDTVYIKGKAVKVSYVYIGDEVSYCIQQHCYNTHCHDCPLYFLGDENCDGYFEFKADDIGKTVFLTKECKNA